MNFRELLHSKFSAYATPGEIRGDIVYVNYAMVEDFMHLQSLNKPIANHICLSRYGKIFRGNKVASAEARGAADGLMSKR